MEYLVLERTADMPSFCLNLDLWPAPNFGSPSSDGSSKIGRHFSNKVV